MPDDARAVLVAPDSFKGTFRASEVAAAIGRGLESVVAAAPDLMPVADGGEGTLEVLLLALPPTATTTLPAPLCAAAAINWPAPNELAASASRSFCLICGRPIACAVSTIATEPSSTSP